MTSSVRWFGFCGICWAHIYCDITPWDAAGQNIQVSAYYSTAANTALSLTPALTIFIGILYRGRIFNVNFYKRWPVVASLVHLKTCKKEVQNNITKMNSCPIQGQWCWYLIINPLKNLHRSSKHLKGCSREFFHFFLVEAILYQNICFYFNLVALFQQSFRKISNMIVDFVLPCLRQSARVT